MVDLRDWETRERALVGEAYRLRCGTVQRDRGSAGRIGSPRLQRVVARACQECLADTRDATGIRGGTLAELRQLAAVRPGSSVRASPGGPPTIPPGGRRGWRRVSPALPAAGEIVPMVQAAPSKTDTGRILPN